MADYLNTEQNAKLNIEAMQNTIKSDDFDDPNIFPPQERKKVYASILAARMTANSTRNKAKTLEVGLDKAAFDQNVAIIMNSEAFNLYFNRNEAEIKRLAKKGHGGELEDNFNKRVLKSGRMATNLTERNMPTAKSRIEALQDQLKTADPASSNGLRIFSEIFRTRRAVGAQHGNKSFLTQKIDGRKYASATDFENCATFKEFVRTKGPALKKMCGKGHGGLAEFMFKEHVRKLDHIAEDVPNDYLPKANTRIEELQKKIKAEVNPDKKNKLLMELMATRLCVGAQRNQKQTLDRVINTGYLNGWTKAMEGNPAFMDFLKKDPAAVEKAALSGHGGAMEDAFRNHIKQMDHLPEDTFTYYLPTALERTEVLKEKIKAKDFLSRNQEQQVALYAELIGTRRSVGSVRNKKDSLNVKLDPKKLNETVDSLKNCSAFKKFVTVNWKEARDITTAKYTHGGALEDKFKEYVKNLDHIPEDVPAYYMPNAKERCEILQKKIGSSEFASYTKDRQDTIYKELMATRLAVNSKIGDKNSLNKPIDPKKLGEAYKGLGNATMQDFLDNSSRGALRNAAQKGHGGELDKHFITHVANKSYENRMVPEGVASRYVPAPGALLQKMRTNMSDAVKNNPPGWFTVNAEQVKKQTATSMYLMNADMATKNAVVQKRQMTNEKIQEGVDKLMQDEAFQKMFNDLGPFEAARKVANSKAGIMEDYAHALQTVNQQRELVRQQQLQRQQQMQMQNQQQFNYNPVQQNPNVNVQNMNQNLQNNMIQNQQNNIQIQPNNNNQNLQNNNNINPQINNNINLQNNNNNNANLLQNNNNMIQNVNNNMNQQPALNV